VKPEHRLGMARPPVADGGDGLQMWREGSCKYIMNKRSGKPTRDGLPALGLGVGITPNHKNSLLRNVMQGLGIGRLLCT
jgi:hypothetical protein